MENNNLAEQMLGLTRASLKGLARASLKDSMLRLATYKEGRLGLGIDGDDGDMVIHIFGIMPFLLNRDAALMRQWTKTIAELSSTPARDRGNINLCLERVVEDGIVSSTLLDAFKTLHRPRLLLKSTMFSAKFASKALEVNSSVQSLSIDGTNANPFKLEKRATALVAAVNRHPSLAILTIENCDLSRKSTIATLIPVLQHIEDVRLDGNSIGSYGAKLIADCLAKNPRVKNLSLNGNGFDDSDASRIAAALKTNSTLCNLALMEGNSIARRGMMAFYFVILGDNNYNAINDANHYCYTDVLADSDANSFDDPVLNKRIKIFSKIIHDIGGLGDAVPLDLVPRLLIILQGRGIEDDGKPVFNPMDAVFQYVRAFNATLFY